MKRPFSENSPHFAQATVTPRWPWSATHAELQNDSSWWERFGPAFVGTSAMIVKGERVPFYGVLAFCKLHKSATGPKIRVPKAYLDKARDGFVSFVAAVLPVQRQSGSQITNEDYSWMLWITDRGPHSLRPRALRALIRPGRQLTLRRRSLKRSRRLSIRGFTWARLCPRTSSLESSKSPRLVAARR